MRRVGDESRDVENPEDDEEMPPLQTRFSPNLVEPIPTPTTTRTADTPRSGGAGMRRRRRLSPVRESTLADVVYRFFSPRAYKEMVVDGSKRTINSIKSLQHTGFSDVLSGLVIGILMSGFSAVFASTIFGEVDLDRYVDIGVSSQQVSIVASGILHIMLSDAGPVISAPDVNPTIFLGMMASIAQRTIMQGGNETQPNLPELEPVLVTTILAICIISTAVLGVFMMLLGTFRWTRILELVPSSVLCGFMGSVGFTIFYKSLSLAMPLETWNSGVQNSDFWRLLSPALVLGFVMFVRERFSIGRPAVAVPLVMIFPVFLFSCIVFSSKEKEANARRDGWLFPKLEHDLPPSRLYEMSYGAQDRIHWDAIKNCVPTMVLMFLVVITDALLKIAGLKKQLQLFDLRADREVVLMGKYNLLNGLLVGVPSYAQASLTRVNEGIVRTNAKSRIPGMLALVMNLVFLLSGFPLHSYMPRFWLSGILMFAGLQFLADNLWDSRQRLSKAEYVAIWVIIIVNYFFGLAWSVLLSLVLSTLIFTLAYGKEGAIKNVYSGSNYRSSCERSAKDLERLEHLGRKVLIVRLHRFVFFGSASLVNEFIKGFLDEQRKVIQEELEATSGTTGEAGKCSFFVFDFEYVEDIDHTALSILNEMMQRLLMSGSEHGDESSSPVVLFTSLNQNLYNTLEEESIVSMLLPRGNARTERVFPSLDLGMEWVEDLLLARSASTRRKWLAFDSFKKLHNQARAFALNEASDHVLGVRLGSLIFRYSRELKVPAGAKLYDRGERDPCCYIIQSGRLTLYSSRTIEAIGIGDEVQTSLVRERSLKRGAFLNEAVLYADDDAVPSCTHTCIADVDSLVYSLNREDLKVLDQELPDVAIEFHRKVARHSTRVSFMSAMRGGHANDYYAEKKHFDQSLANKMKSMASTPGRATSPDRSSTVSPPPGSHGGERSSSKKGFLKGIKAAFDEDSALLEGGQKLTRFVKTMGKTILDMPVINESLVVAGFREDVDNKRGLLEVGTLNSGEISGRNVARELLFVDPAELMKHTVLTTEEYQRLYDAVNDKLEADWNRISHGASVIFPDQIARVFTVSRYEANEMVWDADVAGRGGITLPELIVVLTTIEEKEVQVDETMNTSG